MHVSNPKTFTIVSAIIVIGVLAATGFTASVFYRQAMIERELSVMHDMVRVLVREEATEASISAWDLKNYAENAAKEHLEHSFTALTGIPDFVAVKVFNPDARVAWSTETELIGTFQSHHMQAVKQALADDIPSVFNPALVGTTHDILNYKLIEYYIPFKLGADGDPVAGVVSVYRSSSSIDAAIREGVLLLWLVTGLGGTFLYAALYRLFRTVYEDRRKIRKKFSQLTADQKRLVQIERLSAMGQMVTEVAHQLNNPLVGVINLAELAEREIGNQARVKELLRQVRTAGEHCRDYVQRVLQLNQLIHSDRKVTDLRQLVHETVAFFQQSFGQHPHVTFETPVEAASCKTDPVLIRNALLNLIHNAVQADRIGPIVVSLIREQHDGTPGYSLIVSDHGPGISPEVADKLFTPFFTTRTDGTGLGLSVAQHIAILHGGTIKAENRADGGSRFTIWIPKTQADK
jgi:signal transduction histidine kinase